MRQVGRRGPRLLRVNRRRLALRRRERRPQQRYNTRLLPPVEVVVQRVELNPIQKVVQKVATSIEGALDKAKTVDGVEGLAIGSFSVAAAVVSVADAVDRRALISLAVDRGAGVVEISSGSSGFIVFAPSVAMTTSFDVEVHPGIANCEMDNKG